MKPIKELSDDELMNLFHQLSEDLRRVIIVAFFYYITSRTNEIQEPICPEDWVLLTNTLGSKGDTRNFKFKSTSIMRGYFCDFLKIDNFFRIKF